MKSIILAAVVLLTGCASLDLAGGLSGAGREITQKSAQRAPALNPITINQLRPF